MLLKIIITAGFALLLLRLLLKRVDWARSRSTTAATTTTTATTSTTTAS